MEEELVNRNEDNINQQQLFLTIILFSILKKYVIENTDNVENIEHIKVFMNSIPNLIDIYKSIDTKKIKIKLKKFNCFLPLCG